MGLANPAVLRGGVGVAGRIMHRKGGGMTAFRYKAFISYSWADAVWGNWLQKAVETYRTPAALIGKDGALGPVPARLHPLFKDREEEAAGASIGAAVETALAASEFLIVVCSPNSAKSKWVDREVAWFKTHRDPAKILALIVGGEPGSTAAECFPRALTHRVLPDLSITDQAEDAPLAADARDSGDGKRKARLKIAAALLGVGLDELVRRDDRRRTLRVRLVVGGSLAMSALALAAVRARDEADFQRAESDGLVEFMLTDLRDKLEPVGRLDALDVVGQRALKYYAGQRASKLDADALGRRARALHLVGEVSNIRGDSAAGLTAFREAAATTGEQLARDPDNPQRIFDHAQSVYWVGYTAYERGENKEAEAQFREYKRLADQLAAIDPNNADWQLEVSYAESNLGTLLFNQGRYAEAELSFAKALQIAQAIAAKDPSNVSKQIDLGQATSWLAYTMERQERIEPALELYQREIAIYEKVLAKDPGNSVGQMSRGPAWAGIGKVETMRGSGARAIAAFQNSIEISQQLRVTEPGNTLWQQYEVKRRYEYGTAALLFGRTDEGWRQLAAARALLAKLVAKDGTNDIWNIDLSAQLAELETRLLIADRRYADALRTAETAVGLLKKRADLNDPVMQVVFGSVHLLRGDANARLGRTAEARQNWSQVDRATSSEDDTLPSSLLTVRFIAAKRLGNTNRTSELRTILNRRAWRHPVYSVEAR
jgi:tetratricopeptide (TPR) repeat protein